MTTALDPAAEWRAGLVKTLVERGVLPDPAWRDAFAAVPREAFVPRFARRERGELVQYDIASDNADNVLAAVYSDASLITQLNASGIATSSSSQPSLMAIMLERLAVRDGDTVLEIGTGTGYNAALLTHRLGDDAVTTIDVEPDIVDQARQVLHRTGYHPVIMCGNGANGVPQRAPYDRTIATCGVSRIPAPWLAQTKPSGKILANIGLGLVLLTVDSDGSASGRFDSEPAAFMQLHHEPADTTPSIGEVLAAIHGDGAARPTTMPPHLDHPVIEFLFALVMPGVLRTVLPTDPPTHVLADPATESWAKARINEHDAIVTEHGPRRLWDELSAVITAWDTLEHPEVSDYAIKIDRDGTHHVHHQQSGWTFTLQ